jgi:hypothetical protein
MTYQVEWGDGSMDEGFVEPGGSFTLSHAWTEEGDYALRARLVDDYGAESNWTTFDVSIPRTRALHIFNWLRFLGRVPFIRQILTLVVL